MKRFLSSFLVLALLSQPLGAFANQTKGQKRKPAAEETEKEASETKKPAKVELTPEQKASYKDEYEHKLNMDKAREDARHKTKLGIIFTSIGAPLVTLGAVLFADGNKRYYNNYNCGSDYSSSSYSRCNSDYGWGALEQVYGAIIFATGAPFAIIGIVKLVQGSKAKHRLEELESKQALQNFEILPLVSPSNSGIYQGASLSWNF